MENLLSIEEAQVRDLLYEETITSKYSSNNILRALVQMIPFVGPLFDAIIAIPGDKYKEERLNRFLLLLYKSIKEIEGTQAKEEFHNNSGWINSEEFYDILNLAIEGSLKSRSKEKMLINVMILTNLLSVNNNDNFRPEEYIYALESLSPIEVKILLIFYKSYSKESDNITHESELQKASRIDVKANMIKEIGIDEADLLFMLKRIEKSGFIKEITGTYFNYTGGSFTITESLNKMMDYLSKHPFHTLII